MSTTKKSREREEERGEPPMAYVIHHPETTVEPTIYDAEPLAAQRARLRVWRDHAAAHLPPSVNVRL